MGGFPGALRRLGRHAFGRSARGEMPQLLHRPIDLVPGIASRGEDLAAGLYEFGDQTVDAEEVGERGDTPWRHRAAGEFWLADLHGFAWLRDLRATDSAQAAERGRAMVLDWLRQHRTIKTAAAAVWGPEALGQRLSAWLAHSDFLLQGADDEFTRRFRQGLELQTDHLARTARNASGRTAATGRVPGTDRERAVPSPG